MPLKYWFISFSANSKKISIFFLSHTELTLNFLLYIQGTEVPKFSHIEQPNIIQLWSVISGFRYDFLTLWRLMFKLLCMLMKEDGGGVWGLILLEKICSQMSFVHPLKPKTQKQVCAPSTRALSWLGHMGIIQRKESLLFVILPPKLKNLLNTTPLYSSHCSPSYCGSSFPPFPPVPLSESSPISVTTLAGWDLIPLGIRSTHGSTRAVSTCYFYHWKQLMATATF